MQRFFRVWPCFALLLFLTSTLSAQEGAEKVWRGKEVQNNLGALGPTAIHVDWSAKMTNPKDGLPPSEFFYFVPQLQTLVIGGPYCWDDLILLESIEKYLPSLRVLILDSTDVTDQAVQKLKEKRPKLLVLRSQRWAIAKIYQVGAHSITIETKTNTKYPALRKLLGDSLFQYATKVSFAGLPDTEGGPFHPIINEELMAMKYLDTVTSLDLTWSRINDAGLQYLKGYEQLEQLMLPMGEISDDGLLQLQQLPKLRQLDVRLPRYRSYVDRSSADMQGRYERLKKLLPHCRITSTPPL